MTEDDIKHALLAAERKVPTEWKLVVAVLVICALALGAWAYHNQLKADAAADGKNAILTDQLKALTQDLKDIQKDTAKKLDEKEKEKDAIKTTPQATRVIERVVPGAVVVREPTPEEIAAATKRGDATPAAPSAVLTGDQTVALGKHLVACEQSEIGRLGCEAEKAKIAQARDDWKAKYDNERAKTHPGFWKGTRRAAGCLVVGGAAAGVGAMVAGTKGAAIGGAGGAAACPLVNW